MGLMNIFKPKKPWIRFYSIDPGVAEITPIYPARKLHRQWRTDALKSMNDPARRCPYLRVERLWKRSMDVITGRDSHDGESMELAKHAITCPALTGIMDSGYILPAPGDFVIKTDGTGVNFEWISSGQFCDNTRYINSHIPDQTTGFRELVDQQKDVLDWTIKLETPWRVQAHPDVVFIQVPVTYHKEDRFSCATGLVDPAYSYEINMQLFWHKIEEGEYHVKAGTPLAQWIPVHRDFLNAKGWNVVIETANEHDVENNKIMDYQRAKEFNELNSLSDRIKAHKKILSLNKNIERFN